MGRDKSGKLKKFRVTFLVGLALVILLVILWQLLPRLEGQPPEVNLSGFNSALGVSADFSLTVSDDKNNIRKVWVALLADGQEHVLTTYDQSQSEARPSAEKRFEVTIEPAKMHLSDGPAILRIAAWDNSWRNWGKGNQVYLEKEVVIDTRPPEVEIISRHHYINPGGAGLAVYRVKEPDVRHGVQVGDDFFPGYAGAFEDEHICLAFFALAHDQDRDKPFYVRAVDRAGNASRAGLYYRIRSESFQEDRLRITDSFLRRKMPEFSEFSDLSPLDKFIRINSEMRQKNNQKVQSLCRETDPVLHWQGRFLRFPNSARKASFADHRSYVYQDRVIGKAVHMGIDLASRANSPVPAANTGRVVFTGEIGIYGKTVIIDHGFGLFSLYAHLSHTAVEEGQMIEAGQILGRSGMTGLAAGDHLHFGMLVHDTFVNPVEWWDAAWIENNITTKIKTARQMQQDGAWSSGGFR